MNPLLSLVTGTRNRPLDLQRLVDSIGRHTHVDWELIIADASDQVHGLVASEWHAQRLTILLERPRLGCTKGYNVAFRQTRGHWVLWLNDDVEVQPGYAEAAIRFMDMHPEIGIGALYYADAGTGEHYHVNECGFGMLYANFGILRRDLGEQVGWFDEDLAMYGNDNSLTYRVLMAGKGVAGIPEARIFHHSTKDQYRTENNHNGFRQQQAELLRAKYGPYLAEMRAVYERTRLVAV